MPTVHFIAKSISPEQLSWRARIARNEKPLRDAFLAWVAEIQAAIPVESVAQAIVTRGAAMFDHVLAAIRFTPNLNPVAAAEAQREFEQVISQLDAGIKLSFNLSDPNFATAVAEHEARLVREVSTETRRNIANMVGRGYRMGTHPYDVAKQIRASIGLTARQGQAVLNYSDALTAKGLSRDVVSSRSERYAGRMLTRRAKTIAVTETARGMTAARLLGWDQAAANGLFDRATAEMEWSSVQDDPEEICAQLDGTTVALGDTWDGLLPGDAHPLCRCSAILRLPDSGS